MQARRSALPPLRGFDFFSLMAAALAPVPLETRPVADVPSEAPDSGPPRGLLDRLDQWLWDRHQRDVEAYLARSADVYELEARQRALARGIPIPYY